MCRSLWSTHSILVCEYFFSLSMHFRETSVTDCVYVCACIGSQSRIISNYFQYICKVVVQVRMFSILIVFINIFLDGWWIYFACFFLVAVFLHWMPVSFSKEDLLRWFFCFVCTGYWNELWTNTSNNSNNNKVRNIRPSEALNIPSQTNINNE